MIKYPHKLKKGDTIGITAVSDGANLLKIDRAISNLKELGFGVIETPNTRNSFMCVSSDGKTRAKEFITLWKDPNVKHILSARGGEFLMEMLPYLDEYADVLKNTDSIKWVQGYSDPSLLLFYLTTKYHIATIHAENLSEFAMKLEHYHSCLKNTISFLKSEDIEFVQTSFDKFQLQEFEEGNLNGYQLTENVKYELLGSKDTHIAVEGRLIGGCVDVLALLMGTPFDTCSSFCSQFSEGMIWYLDNCELNAAELYRRLWKMRELGWFSNANAFLIGRTFSGQAVQDFTYLEALKKALYDLNVPIIYNADIGHVPPQLTLINGAFVKVEFLQGKIKLIQKLIP